MVKLEKTLKMVILSDTERLHVIGGKVVDLKSHKESIEKR